MITRDECVERLQRIWAAVDDLSKQRALSAVDMAKFEALTGQFDLLDAVRLCHDMGVPQHEIPLVVAALAD
jgi:hypothetical protein